MGQAIGLVIIATEFLLVMMPLLNSGRNSANYGGAILIWPITIVFGSSPEMAIVTGIIATGLMVLVFLPFMRH